VFNTLRSLVERDYRKLDPRFRVDNDCECRQPRDPSAHLIEGVKHGFPLCCIAQYISDHYNAETFNSGTIRRGEVFSRKGRCNYVPCFDCDEQCTKEVIWHIAEDWCEIVTRGKGLSTRKSIETQ